MMSCSRVCILRFFSKFSSLQLWFRIYLVPSVSGLRYRAVVLYISNLVCFSTLEGFRIIFMIPVICKNIDNLFETSFSCSYDSKHPK
jgi:hypothetical protein